MEVAGLTVVTVAPEAFVSVDGYDAVILGSGIYAGRWLETAKSFVERNREALVMKRVWLFSSGPTGDPPKPVEEPADAAPMVAATGAIEHRTFAGRVDKESLGFGEKVVMAALRAPEGDFRPWDDIDAWAWNIAKALKAEPVAV
jgi:menaquinone-dependent protoporphyrinogen oxidase